MTINIWRHKCHDCGALPGEYHKPGCDVEKCPICGDQLITCGHYRRVMKGRRRVPHVNRPVVCSLCGKLYPRFFTVPDRTWAKQVPPHLQRDVICRGCYNRLRKMLPGGWAKYSRKRGRLSRWEPHRKRSKRVVPSPGGGLLGKSTKRSKAAKKAWKTRRKRYGKDGRRG